MINSEYEEYFKNGVLKRRKNKKKIQKVPYSRSSSYSKGGEETTLLCHIEYHVFHTFLITFELVRVA